MLGIRALWIVSSNAANDDWQLIYTRRHNIVEAQARKLLKEKYISIPRDNYLIIKSILCQVGLEKKTSEEFIEKRDTCTIVPRLPVIEATIADSTKLWPVVVVEHCGHLFCALPLIENSDFTVNSISSLVQMKSVTAALSTLISLQTFFGPLQTPLQKSSPILEQLDKYLSLALPFGRPGELEPTLIQSSLTFKPVITDSKQSIIPSGTKGQTITIKITEYIRGIQYDNPDIKNIIDVYGSITWTGCLEKPQTEVTLNLSSTLTKNDLLPLKFVTLHPCVSQIDQDELSTTHKFRFKPILLTYPLCYYSVQAKRFPILGSYKLSYMDKHFELALQLSLEDKVRNNFDVCEVTIPLFQKLISTYDLRPSWGNVMLSKDCRNVIWSLGQQLPSSTSVTLKGSVYMTSQVMQNDIKISLSEAYVQVHFKIADFTLSGHFIDVNSIQTSVATNVKINCKREFCSVEYKIWNTNCIPPIHFNQKLISEPQTPV